MKTGRNDPCPCGSGKKYKQCCLTNPKIIPFPGNSPEPPGNKSVKLSGMPPVNQLMGVDSIESYNAAFAKYSYYCENIVKDGDRIPSFKEYSFGVSSENSVFTDLDIQNQISGANSIEEADAILSGLIGNYNSSLEESSHVPIEELLQELILEGPLKAKNVVAINKKVRLTDLRKTPVFQMSLAFLDYLGRNNGVVPVNENNPNNFFKIIAEETDLNIFTKDSQGKTNIGFWYKLVNNMLQDKGYIIYRNSVFTITDKGVKFRESRGTRANYFQFLKYLTEGINWFFDSGLDEKIEDLQDIAGLSLLVIEGLSRHEHYLTPEVILKTVDSVYHILDELEEVDIDNRNAIDIFDDYFLNGYCRLLGFVNSVLPKAGTTGDGITVPSVEPTKLFFDLCEWEVVL